ncbi:FAD:protein FMN transferase [bacterium]|nr:FAD:protein FMN transferase [bacterium]
MAATLQAGLFKLQFKALGTHCVIQFRADEISVAKEFKTVALAWIKDFENTWSRFKPDSLLCRINASAGRERIPLTHDQDHVLQLCGHTYRQSQSLIDPTSFPLTQLWDDAAQKDQLPSEEEITEVKKRVDWNAIEHSPGSVFLPEKGIALEIGGFGKEYAVDRLIDLAKHSGIKNLLVDLGRDVAAAGTPPHGSYWVVGAENAREEDTALHRLAITDRAVATSGNGRRFRTIGGEKFGHIIDSRSGRPAETDVLTATCLAPDCLTAGLLSTTAEIDRRLNTCGIIQTSEGTRFSNTIHQHLLSS